jgi:hypothetical protein
MKKNERGVGAEYGTILMSAHQITGRMMNRSNVDVWKICAVVRMVRTILVHAENRRGSANLTQGYRLQKSRAQ